MQTLDDLGQVRNLLRHCGGIGKIPNVAACGTVTAMCCGVQYCNAFQIYTKIVLDINLENFIALNPGRDR